MKSLIRVLLADSHIIMRAGLRQLLEQHESIRVVAEAENGEQAYQLCVELLPNVIMMELSMPNMGGLEALHRIKARDKEAKVIILSMDENITYATQALAAGAVAYISKSCDADDLIKAVVAAATGEKYLSAVMALQIALQHSSNDNPLQELSTREFEVFRLLADGKAVENIAKQLNVCQKTVANYQTVLKQKLGIHNSVELVRLAMRFGIITN